MNSQEFVAKWREVNFKERSFYQEHFIDLCHLVGHPTPIEDGDKNLFSFDAYGWEHDVSDEEILERLLALNLERAAQQKRR